MRVILGSTSPARLGVLRAAGIQAEVIAPEVDESAVHAGSPVELTAALARIKGQAVLEKLRAGGGSGGEAVLLACDSMLEIEGTAHGKPGTAEAAIVRWYRMRGRRGVLHTGHFVAVLRATGCTEQLRTASTTVSFADLSDAEIAAYAATGEPQHVAGAFTIDGLGGPFITGIEGDPHNVVGISLPLVRQMLIDMGVSWPSLWTTARGGHAG